MKKSTYHQIIGALVCAGRQDLVEGITTTNSSDPIINVEKKVSTMIPLKLENICKKWYADGIDGKFGGMLHWDGFAKTNKEVKNFLQHSEIDRIARVVKDAKTIFVYYVDWGSCNKQKALKALKLRVVFYNVFELRNMILFYK